VATDWQKHGHGEISGPGLYDLATFLTCGRETRTMRMKTIGLIGGISWEASSDYYRTINAEVLRRLGGAHSARAVLVSLDFHEIIHMTRAGDEEGVFAIYSAAAKRLQQAGAEFLVLCANTAHRFADRLASVVDLPLLHIGDAAGLAIRRANCTVVGLLGTRRTMEGGFIADRLWRHHGISTLIPSERHRHEIDQRIFQEMVVGVFSQAARAVIIEAARDLIARGAEGIVLGCTELPILMRGHDLGVISFDTATLHAIAAVNFALCETPSKETSA
jgi:aspartate racemase